MASSTASSTVSSMASSIASCHIYADGVEFFQTAEDHKSTFVTSKIKILSMEW